MEYYLIHLFAPIFKGTEEQCKAALEKLTSVKATNMPKHFLIVSKEEYENIIKQ